ncbi:hypothetical protein ACQPYK_19440 [Streptosporangium sp. CA-135522]|uniref:hypothetical protein n=1 Tax=Streptosporangium sp. CA-135522 TaxID=3240072 RepID=UPI003D94F07C
MARIVSIGAGSAELTTNLLPHLPGSPERETSSPPTPRSVHDPADTTTTPRGGPLAGVTR